MNQFSLILKELSQTELESVLVTVIHVEGSAYLREGTTMLIKKDDTTVGMISPGCLEEDVVQQAKKVFEDKKAMTLVYDMADSDDWGVGNGCNGTLYLILEYIDEGLKQKLLSILDDMNSGLHIIHQKIFNKKYEFMHSVFDSLHHQPNDSNDRKLIPHESGYVFTHMIVPKNRLIIFGAGIDVKPLVVMAGSCDFHVILIDSNPLICNEQNIPGADQYMVASPPYAAIRELEIQKNDFIVIMTHHYLKDKNILQKLKGKVVDYIGIMGTKKRTKKLLDSNIADNHYSPIGLDIGAEGPYEIAVSIMAELIKIRNEKRMYK